MENELIKVRDSHKKELHELNAKLDSIANTKNKEYDMVVKRVILYLSLSEDSNKTLSLDESD